jgi:hypothetical protein
VAHVSLLLVHRQLMENVAGDRHDVSFGVADCLVALDAPEPEENFLDEVGDVGGVTETRGEMRQSLRPCWVAISVTKAWRGSAFKRIL